MASSGMTSLFAPRASAQTIVLSFLGVHEEYQIRSTCQSGPGLVDVSLQRALCVERGLTSVRSLAVANIVTRLGDPRKDIRRSARLGLPKFAQRGNPDLVKQLLSCVGSAYSGVCSDALSMLQSWTNGDDARELVVKHLWDDREPVRRAAQSALPGLVSDAPELAPKLIVHLARSLRSHTVMPVNRGTLDKVLVSIAMTGGNTAIAAIQEHLGLAYMPAVRRAMQGAASSEIVPRPICGENPLFDCDSW